MCSKFSLLCQQHCRNKILHIQMFDLTDCCKKMNRNAVQRIPEELEGKILTMLSSLVAIEPPGMREIKQVELFTKWRPLITEKYRDLNCPKPSPEIMERIMQSKIAKQNSKNTSKKTSKKATPNSSLNSKK